MHPCKIILPVYLLLTISSSAQVNINDSIHANKTVFSKVDVEASFPGGDNAWKTYLQKNLRPDIPQENGAPLGFYTVIVKFVVGADGNLADIQSATNWGYGMEKEVIRIIQNSGKWLPAMQNGRPVNAYRRQPVSFQFEEDGFEIYSKDKYYLYTGMDNPLTVDIRKVNNENITLSISQGTITPTADGQFTASVTEPGRAIITVYSKRKNKELGKMSFEVKAKK
jgi:hypothetical protein